MKGKVLLLILISVFLVSCRGQRSEVPPIHLNPNLDFQAKVKSQTQPQHPVDGTVAWGKKRGFSDADSREQFLKSDTVYYTGKTKRGTYVSKVPVTVDEALINRGQERYTIYCSMCHDRAGTGQGTVIKRGYPLPPKFSDARLLAMSDGQIFDVIGNGVRNMPGYSKQIPEADRWAIVSYVRALQKMNTASYNDLPKDLKKKLK